ncbi:hypothetical protein O181_008837 [Austropuccinia psidii MF-1]|uniref:Uncharacterized protein n=1 Tax=Austropuccinia psidii MF-1 TaxID=1389203 RepID=A0A9Q3GJR6_9BASI|nr:hypothetical protein [Austropuccinia psidii MF-1]
MLDTNPFTIPPHSPSPALVSKMRQSPLSQPIYSPMDTSQQLQPVISSSRRREDQFPLPFPATQVFQKREFLPIWLTREDQNMPNEGQDALARLFRRVDRNSREVTEYANDRTIPGTTSEEMAEKSSWCQDELINDFQRAFHDLGRDKKFPFFLFVHVLAFIPTLITTKNKRNEK